MRTIRWGGRGAKEGWQHDRQQKILGMEIPKGGNDVQEGEIGVVNPETYKETITVKGGYRGRTD